MQCSFHPKINTIGRTAENPNMSDKTSYWIDFGLINSSKHGIQSSMITDNSIWLIIPLYCKTICSFTCWNSIYHRVDWLNMINLVVNVPCYQKAICSSCLNMFFIRKLNVLCHQKIQSTGSGESLRCDENQFLCKNEKVFLIIVENCCGKI